MTSPAEQEPQPAESVDAPAAPGAGAAPEPVSDKSQAEQDAEKDALHILPLEIIPLQTEGLRKWRMMKNVRLESVVEVFNNKRSGSGQIKVDELRKYFDADRGKFRQDLVILRQLAALESFDVYSLRISLRWMKVKVNESTHLQLSEQRKVQLGKYMRDFTRPLIQKVFGSMEEELEGATDVVALFTRPDKEETLRNLKLLSEKLQTGLDEIPLFLEEYGDNFLSVAYYKNVYDRIRPNLKEFRNWMAQAADTYAYKHDAAFHQKVQEIDSALDFVARTIETIMKSYQEMSKTFWDDINAASFRVLKDRVTRQHAALGAMLCGLFVKIDAWTQRFGNAPGSPDKRAEFVSSEMLPGLERVLVGMQSTLHGGETKPMDSGGSHGLRQLLDTIKSQVSAQKPA